ncbi:MAG: hypothetical protein LBR22_07680 [Desulfovibrio sp.]|jgi:hypothetical protein|nr:hypothetical protein [Desulfovibrio sp.]
MIKRYCLLAFCLLALCACGRAVPPPPAADADGPWQAYLADSAARPDAPFRLGLSLRFGTEGDTRRVTALLWGNGDGRLRMDVMAGVGVLAASYMETDDHVLMLDPRARKAYFHRGSLKPRLKMEFPLPFDLGRLAKLLTGHWVGVFGTGHGESEALPVGRGYRLEGDPGGWLTLDSRGLPIAWREDDAEGWRMDIAYDEGQPPLPRRVQLAHGKGGKAILLVRERETVRPFEDEQLRLALPADVALLPMPKDNR